MDTVQRLNENLSKLDSVRKDALAFLDKLLDKKSFVEMGTFASGTTFADGVSAEGEGIITGYATINGVPVYLFYQNFEAMRGSFSFAQAKKIEAVIKMAEKSSVPFISIIDSAGARLQEGVKVLEGYAKILKLAGEIKNVIPHIAVIKGASVGLMSAYACMADFVLYDEKGYLSLGTPSVVLAKDGSKKSEIDVFGADAGLHAGTCTLKYNGASELKGQIAEILSFMANEVIDNDDPNRTASDVSNNQNVLANIVDNGSALELNEGYTNSTKTYFARINGYPVGILSAEGLIKCGDLKKITKFVKLLDGYNIPLVTLVNSDGFESDLKHEGHGIANVSAGAFGAVAVADNPKIAVITGSAIGGAYALLASKELGYSYTLAFSDAKIAPLSADQAVNFYDTEFKGDVKVEKEKLIEEYTLREGNPFLSAKDGFIDNIIDGKELRPYLASVLSMIL